MIRKQSLSFYRTTSGVRLCWELEEPKGPKLSLREESRERGAQPPVVGQVLLSGFGFRPEGSVFRVPGFGVPALGFSRRVYSTPSVSSKESYLEEFAAVPRRARI